MTELELYKFINENEIEYSWSYNPDVKDGDVVLWIPFYLLEDFCKMIGSYFTSEGGVEVRLQDRCIALFASQICHACGIELEKIFKEKESQC